MRRRSSLVILTASLVLLFAAQAAGAQTIVDEWGQAKFPAPPQLKQITIVPNETALLVMDFTVQTCTPERRKRCADSVPKVKKFVEEARGKGAMIVPVGFALSLKGRHRRPRPHTTINALQISAGT